MYDCLDWLMKVINEINKLYGQIDSQKNVFIFSLVTKHELKTKTQIQLWESYVDLHPKLQS